MRYFIALPLPEELKQEISKLQSQLKETQADVKWVNSKDLHITLKFLGGIEQEKVETISEKLNRGLDGFLPFTFTIGEIGSFPSLESPKVIWIGVEKNRERVVELAEKVEELLKTLGFSHERRPFHPHLTLGRIRSRKQIGELIRKLKSLKIPEFRPVEVERVILFQSILKPEGPEYKILREFKL
ncbi:MAG TPA: RNA 2',3'-cyclic phosphodiesterase, partial [Candidatus Omnitrophica bacterium]|nr:RNA 2',3'-cyclic phosphodiesterase [Candidatus Omnitrophota bacterium]